MVDTSPYSWMCTGIEKAISNEQRKNRKKRYSGAIVKDQAEGNQRRADYFAHSAKVR